MKLAFAAAASALAVAASPASAAITVNFDTLANNVAVNNYYNGGTASDGTTSQMGNQGVQFVNFTTATANNPASRIAYNSSAPAVASVFSGFTSLTFDYGFLIDPGTVTVYSGLSGSGSVLGSATFASNVSVNMGQAFSAGGVAFSGIARSFVLAGSNGRLALDNIVFGTDPVASPVPEPAGWGLMLAGFGLVGAGLRARRRNTAVRFA